MILVALVCGIGMNGKNCFWDKGILAISSIEEMNKMKCLMEAGSTKDSINYFKGYTEEMMERYGEAENIAIVIPTGNVKVYSTGVVQEVTVQKMIKGGVEKETIWLEKLGGSFHVNDSDKVLSYAEVVNIMQSENRYLCFFDSIPLNERTGIFQYHLYESDYFSAINLDATNDRDIINAKQVYSFGELKNIEFFCTDYEELQYMNKIKSAIIEKYL